MAAGTSCRRYFLKTVASGPSGRRESRASKRVTEFKELHTTILPLLAPRLRTEFPVSSRIKLFHTAGMKKERVVALEK
jgi:hypothetical protein